MMTQSLSGILNRAADHCEKRKDAEYLAYPLRVLLKNLRELRERRSEGTAVLEEFFSVYSIEGFRDLTTPANIGRDA